MVVLCDVLCVMLKSRVPSIVLRFSYSIPCQAGASREMSFVFSSFFFFTINIIMLLWPWLAS